MSTSSFSSRRALANTLSPHLFGARARNFNNRKRTTTTNIMSTTIITTTSRLSYHRSYTTSQPASTSYYKHPSQPSSLARSQSANLSSSSSNNSHSSNSNVFTSPFWSLDHCAHCYPNGPPQPGANLQEESLLKEDLKRISEETIRSTKFDSTSSGTGTSGSSNDNKAGSGVGTNLSRGELSGSFSSHLLSHPHPHTHPHTHVNGQSSQQPSHVNMSTSASTPTTPIPTTALPKPTPKPTPKPGQGILVPASKVHTTVKSELLHTLSSGEFNPELDVDGRRGRGVKLVGILATGMEDAASYAEVSREGQGWDSGSGFGWGC